MNTEAMTGARVPEFDPADSELIDRCVRQLDQEAFSILRNRYHRMVYATCRGYLGGCEALVDDAVQAVFILLLRRAKEIHKHGNLAGWLHVVARNVSRTIARSETRRKHWEREAHDLRCDETTSETETDQLASQLLEAIDELSSKDKEAIILHYFQRLSFESVARKMHRSEDSIKVRVSRARTRIRGIFERKGVTVTMSVIVVLLEESVTARGEDGSKCSTASPSETARSVADAVMAEMDRAAATAMWWKVCAGAAGVVAVGVGVALVVSHLQSATVGSATSWRVESVAGNAVAKRGETALPLKMGDAILVGDAILTSSNQEIRMFSGSGDRILLREEGEMEVGSAGAYALSLSKGAIVAQVTHSTRFATPQAHLDAGNAEFSLTIAESTNEFTRLEVTRGSVQCSNGMKGGVGTGSSTVWVHAGHGVCVESGFVGKAYETDGREVSPRHGGVFFRDHLKNARWEGWTGLPPTTAPLDVRHFTPENMVAAMTKAENVTTRVERSTLFLDSNGKDLARVIIDCGVSKSDSVRLRVRCCFVLTQDGAKRLDFKTSAENYVPESLPPSLPSERNASFQNDEPFQISDGVWCDIEQVYRLVGRTRYGDPIYMHGVRIGSGDGQSSQLARLDLSLGSVDGYGFIFQGMQFRIKELRVEVYGSR